jgi:hypothetical protein
MTDERTITALAEALIRQQQRRRFLEELAEKKREERWLKKQGIPHQELTG